MPESQEGLPVSRELGEAFRAASLGEKELVEPTTGEKIVIGGENNRLILPKDGGLMTVARGEKDDDPYMHEIFSDPFCNAEVKEGRLVLTPDKDISELGAYKPKEGGGGESKEFKKDEEIALGVGDRVLVNREGQERFYKVQPVLPSTDGGEESLELMEEEVMPKIEF